MFKRMQSVWVAALLTIGSAVGCSGEVPAGSKEAVSHEAAALTTAHVVSLTEPSGINFRTTAITANETVQIGDRAQVLTSSGGFGAVTNAGNVLSDFGVSSQVGAVTSLARVALHNGARINGSLKSGGTVSQSTGVVITGSVTANATFPAPDVASWQVQFVQSSQNVTLTAGQSASLAPGAYSGVTIFPSAHLTLHSGTYYIDQLDLELQGTITLDESAGPIVLYVQTSLVYRGTVSGGTPDKFLVAYLGGLPVTMIESSFNGTLVAPSAPVRLGIGGTGHAGSFFAKDLQIDPDVHLTFVPYAGWNSLILGVNPTLNCVVQLNSTTYGAVFGYQNTTGSQVAVAAGSRNSFSPGAVDMGQPIVFVPGQVPVANFQTFPANGSLSYTLGQQTVIASSTSHACSAAFGTALSQLFVETADTRAVRQSLVGVLSNPHFASWVNNVRTATASQLSPFESSLFDSLSLVAANADLLGDPAALTSAQLARLPGFRAVLLAKPAIVTLRAAGDALRANASAPQCNSLAAIDRQKPVQPFLPVQAGSVYSQSITLGTSQAFKNLQTALAGVATGTQSAALFGAPGLVLAGFLSPSDLANLDLAGPIPTSLLGKIVAVVGGAVTGAVVGFAAGGPAGAVVGAVAGGAIVLGGSDALDANSCTPCQGDVDCGDSKCTSGCCANVGDTIAWFGFLTGSGCANSAASCQTDSACGTGLKCIQACCVSPPLVLNLCPTNGCSSNANCSGGNTCQSGCCAGRCGIGGTSCNEFSSLVCGFPNTACVGDQTCDDNGCCQSPPPR